MERIAAVDLGSLTVRLAVAEVTGKGRFEIIYRRREITSLGEGLEATGELESEAQERTLKALAGFGADIQTQGVSKGMAVATEAVRQARNGREFLQRAGEALHLPVTLLTPEEEAGLTLTGVLSVLDPGYRSADPLLIVDVGGGSTEFVLLHQDKDPVVASLPMGVLSLSRLRPLGDPPNPRRVDDLKRELRRLVQDFLRSHFRGLFASSPLLVGTAGTVTTLAAMAQGLAIYDPNKINNFLLLQEKVEELTSLLASLPEEERARLPGLEPAKAKVMVTGALFIQALFHATRQDKMITVDAGLLEGVLAELAK